MRVPIILAVLILTPTLGLSATYYVPDDFKTIQGAISDLSVVNGDIIIVRADTYVENLDFLGKAITVRSQGGEGVVGDQTAPDQTPERLHDVITRFDLDALRELGEERGAPCFESLEQLEHVIVTFVSVLNKRKTDRGG